MDAALIGWVFLGVLTPGILGFVAGRRGGERLEGVVTGVMSLGGLVLLGSIYVLFTPSDPTAASASLGAAVYGMLLMFVGGGVLIGALLGWLIGRAVRRSGGQG